MSLSVDLAGVALGRVAFAVQQLFRNGEIGGAHWFTDPNTLYRRRNRLTYTGGSYASPWATDNSGATNPTVTTNYAAAPDGTMTAARVQLNKTGGVFSRLRCVVSWPTGRQYVVSVYARTTSGSGTANVGLRGGDAAGTNMAVTGTWQRFTYALGTITTPADFQILLWDNIAGNDETADILIWGAQLELGSSATEYQDVPTTWPEAYLAAVGAENIYAWTDSAGTTPVTAVGDTIGLSLDRAFGGRTDGSLIASGATGLTGTATAASYDTSTGAGSVSRAGDASNQSWVSWTGLTTSSIHRIRITNTGATSLDVRNGSVSGTIVASIAAGATSYVHPLTSGGSTSITITATNNSTTATFTVLEFCRVPGTHLTQATGTARPTLSARVNALLNTATMSTQNVTTLAASYRLRFEGTGTVTLSGTATAGPLSAGTHSVTATAGTLTLTVSGSVTSADFRTADDAAKNIPVYQRVGATAADHDTDGFPHYALFDGTDDSWASTATVDGSGSDKVTVVAGVTRNGSNQIVFELTVNANLQNGGLALYAASASEIGLYHRGTSAAASSTTNAGAYTVPHSGVIAGAVDNGTSSRLLMVNGATPSVTSAGTTSAGAFANATLYVGSRAGASLRLNGRIYSLVSRFGAMGEADRNRLEQWTKNLMRLP